MRIKIITALLICVASSDLMADDYPWRTLPATESGIGGVRIGMTLKQASDHFVVSFLEATYFYGSNECSSFAFGKDKDGDHWDIRFLAENNIIERIDVYTPDILSPDGFGVGTDIQDITAYHQGHYKVLVGYDPADRHIRVTPSGSVPLEYTGSGEKTIREGNTVRPDPTEVLTGPVRYWSMGHLDAGSVEGCL